PSRLLLVHGQASLRALLALDCSLSWAAGGIPMPDKRFRRPPTGLNRGDFLALYGPVYEHSLWIAEAVFDGGVGAAHDDPEGLHAAMRAVVEAAPQERRLALLRAHPDLAGRLAVRGELTALSASEQAGAGLDKCSPEEFAKFTRLNEAYKAKF